MENLRKLSIKELQERLTVYKNKKRKAVGMCISLGSWNYNQNSEVKYYTSLINEIENTIREKRLIEIYENLEKNE